MDCLTEGGIIDPFSQTIYFDVYENLLPQPIGNSGAQSLGALAPGAFINISGRERAVTSSGPGVPL